MKFTRPLVFFDLETTGPRPEVDRIVEMAFVKLLPDGETERLRLLINPGMPIPAAASAIHGITDAMIADAYTFAAASKEVEWFIGEADLAGFNVLRFDLPMLEAEFKRAGSPWSSEGRHIVDAMQLFHRFEKRDLAGAVKFYTGAELVGAHGALADTIATLDVLRAQVERYGLESDAASLAKLCVDPDAVDRDGKFKRVDGEVVFTFGKHNGKKLADVAANDPGFLGWMLRSDFSTSTKAVVYAVLMACAERRASRRDSG